MQASVLPPLMFIAQEPQIPERENILNTSLPRFRVTDFEFFFSGLLLLYHREQHWQAMHVAEGPAAFSSFLPSSGLEYRSNRCSSKNHFVIARPPEAAEHWRRTEGAWDAAGITEFPTPALTPRFMYSERKISLFCFFLKSRLFELHLTDTIAKRKSTLSSSSLRGWT